jgi:hypothetical protein
MGHLPAMDSQTQGRKGLMIAEAIDNRGLDNSNLHLPFCFCLFRLLERCPFLIQPTPATAAVLLALVSVVIYCSCYAVSGIGGNTTGHDPVLDSKHHDFKPRFFYGVISGGSVSSKTHTSYNTSLTTVRPQFEDIAPSSNGNSMSASVINSPILDIMYRS